MTGASAPNHSESDPDRPRRTWKLPSKMFGRIRTSTVLLGICFVLTGLLYNQLQEGNDAPTAGPTAVDPSLIVPGPSSEPRYTEESTTTTPVPTTTQPASPSDASGTPSVAPGEPGSTTGGTDSSTTPEPTYLPGLTVPPELRSLLPAPPSATGTP
ncbi:hypothetical protein [Rhodococcoides kyotonense]|uniref:Uncharacterized protein n=1 Tax=Rhodococcoides kyotonense TaxID=398843 RepID=A0A239LSU6_9NOCA|nr:hypothetical protein [Rhodococcus kyotonensis]SNT33012.1 hypothetical protein SAMN05421642_11440 [Rhodococcus kyotonensis]